MPVNAVVIGAGGFGRETLDVIEAWNRADEGETFNVLGVVDDAPSQVNLDRLVRRGYEHLGGLEVLTTITEPFQYFLGIGNPLVRAKVVAQCEAHGFVAGTVVHPSASIGSDTSFGSGTIICGGVQVSTNVNLGAHVHLNPGCTIGHDTTIGNFSSVNPGAIVSGDVVVADRVLIGAGAVVLQRLQIAEGATIGANACATRNVGTGTTVVGTPAKPMA